MPAGITTTLPPQPASLAGNWLLLGPLPSGLSVVPAPSAAMSFDVNGSQITGAGHMELPCTSGAGSLSVGFGAVLAGAVASDGSFTVASPVSAATSLLPGVSVSGTLPKSAGGVWQGTYTMSGGSTVCEVAGTGSFTATAIANVSGTYDGSGTTFFFPSGEVKSVPTPITLTLSLQQGGALYGLGKTLAPYSELALDGSVAVTGIPCFSKGASSPEVQSLIAGSEFVAAFVMDDGSSLMLLGDVSDVDASHLSIIGMSVDGGNCAGTFVPGSTSLLVSR